MKIFVNNIINDNNLILLQLDYYYSIIYITIIYYNNFNLGYIFKTFRRRFIFQHRQMDLYYY